MIELWELPTTWCWTTMGEVTSVVGGGTPSTTNPKNFEGTIPWITPADMSGYAEKAISSGSRFISEQGLEDSGARWLPEGTVLFSSRAPIGYVAIAARPVTTNQGFKSFVPTAGLSSDYIYYWLTSAKRHAEKLASGTTFLEISGAKASLIPFPLAPHAEQIRIVAKLEELLSDLDAGVAELKAAQKKLGQYRQSLLRAAVEGALTAPWREEQRAQNAPSETGAQLLERILTERRARWEAKQIAKFTEQGKTPPKDWQKKYPEPAQPDTTNLPELPENWVWASVEQISEIQGGIQKQPSRAPTLNKYPFLRVANVARGRLKLDEVHEIELFPGELERLALVTGDVLIVEGNGSLTEIGRCAVWDGSIENAVHQNHLIRIRPIGIESQFVETWLNSLGGIEILTQLAATTSGLYTLSVGKISKIPVPLAPHSEQVEAIKILFEHLGAMESQEQAVSFSLKQSTAQRHNILRAAFAGELVPQDPNDEPASVLLERIRTERAERAKQPKTRKTKPKEIATMVSQLIDVLAEAGDWVPAQEAFRRCGVADGTLTERIEELYAELRKLDKEGRLAVEAVTDAQGRKLYDKLKLLAA